MSQIKTKFIANNAITNAKLAQASANTILGNNTGSAANVVYLTTSQVKTLLAISAADIAYTPTTSADWGPTPPTTLQQALDQIAKQTGMMGPN